MGESGTGKTTVAEILCKWYGLKQIQSYTTRPQRYPGEEGHIFLDKSKFTSFDDIRNHYPTIAAEDLYDEELYFATTEQINDCDLYVVTPTGIRFLKTNYCGGKGVKVIRLKCSMFERIDRMSKRGDPDAKIYKRIQNDKIMFAHVGELCDASFINDKRDMCAQRIMKYIKKQEGIQ